MSAMKANAPSHWDLAALWMTIQYDGVPAAVFFTPTQFEGAVGNIISLYNLAPEEASDVAGAEIYVRPGVQPQGESLDDFVNHLSAEEYGYVAAWDGTTFTTENT